MAHIMIIGAGIGGLTTALCLHARGLEVEIYEATSEIAPLGVGINLLPHACQILDELHLLDVLLADGIETQELIFFNKFGQQIWQEPRGIAAGYPWPQISIHRGNLQMSLLAQVEQRIGQDRIHTGMVLQCVVGDGDVARATFKPKQGDVLEIEASGIIAADGIHSTARAQFYPDEGMPLWNGAVMWRGLMETEPFLTGRSMFMAGHQEQKFVAYPVGQSEFEQGRSLTNWIAELRFPITDLLEREDWNRAGNFAAFTEQFSSWEFPWLSIGQLIEDAQTCYEFPMVDRDPIERWSFGRVTLLGDAAHPMYPIGSNGASQAILDAAAITRALVSVGGGADGIVAAFEHYQAERQPATAAVVRANRGNGPEQVMQLAEQRAPHGFTDINDILPLAERSQIAARYKQLAGFSKEALSQAK